MDDCLRTIARLLLLVLLLLLVMVMLVALCPAVSRALTVTTPPSCLCVRVRISLSRSESPAGANANRPSVSNYLCRSVNSDAAGLHRLGADHNNTPRGSRPAVLWTRVWSTFQSDFTFSHHTKLLISMQATSDASVFASLCGVYRLTYFQLFCMFKLTVFNKATVLVV
jgi:hypothetical protein